jgi:hypothetical protein
MTDSLNVKCPFCGSAPEACGMILPGNQFARCTNLDCFMHSTGVAWEIWNKRATSSPDPSLLDSMLAKLEADKLQHTSRGSGKRRLYNTIINSLRELKPSEISSALLTPEQVTKPAGNVTYEECPHCREPIADPEHGGCAPVQPDEAPLAKIIKLRIQQHKERHMLETHGEKGIGLRVADRLTQQWEQEAEELTAELMKEIRPLLMRESIGGWQPIATCPPEMRRVLLTGGTYTWDDGYGSEPLSFVACAYRNSDDGDWRSRANGHDKEYYYEPTHWHPLPAIPEQLWRRGT